MKKRILLPILFLAATALVGCGQTEPPVDYTWSIANKEALTAEWHANDDNREIVIDCEPGINVTAHLDVDLFIESSNTSVVAVYGKYLAAVGAGTATVTVTFDGETDTVDLTILEAINTGTADAPLTVAEALLVPVGRNLYVRGIVKQIDTPWSDSYGNITFTIVDANEDSLYIYRCGTNVAVGDDVTIYGPRAEYKGTPQIGQGNTATIHSHDNPIPGGAPQFAEMTIAQALAQEDGVGVIVRGIVKVINTAWSDSYGNITVTIIDTNLDELYVYRLATNVAVGDDITVTGFVGSYNGAKQIAQGATAVINSSGNAIPGAEEGGDEEEGLITIAEALAAADGTTVTVRGIVKSVGTWSTQYNNMNATIIDENLDELYLFRLGTQVEVGDDITVTGPMATYNEARQMGQGGTAVVNSKGNAIPGVAADAVTLGLTTATNTVKEGSTVTWAGNGITLHIDQGACSASSWNLDNIVKEDHGRLYAQTNVTISFTSAIKTITLSTTGGKNFSASQTITGGTLAVDGTSATITCDAGVTQVTFTPAAQIRVTTVVVVAA